MEHLRNIRSDEILSARLLLNCLAGHPSVTSPTLINLGNLDFRRRNNYKIFLQKQILTKVKLRLLSPGTGPSWGSKARLPSPPSPSRKAKSTGKGKPPSAWHSTEATFPALMLLARGARFTLAGLAVSRRTWQPCPSMLRSSPRMVPVQTPTSVFEADFRVMLQSAPQSSPSHCPSSPCLRLQL